MEFLAVIVQPLAAALAGLAAYYAAKAKKEAGQANAAVNHNGPDQARLYDLAAQTHARLIDLEQRHATTQHTLLDLPCKKPGFGADICHRRDEERTE